MNTVYKSSIHSLPLLFKGKVRDIYTVNETQLLIVTTDRISVFDISISQCVPGKGIVLNTMTNFWFNKMRHIIQNHTLNIDPLSIVSPNERQQISGRAVIVKKLKPILIEAIVRGYLFGNAWEKYKETGKINDLDVKKNMQQGEKLQSPIFTVSTKEKSGQHDQIISYGELENRIGSELSKQIKIISLSLYETATSFALSKDIIIADTKFEFGLDQNNQLILIDEIFTPDSSRFWDAKSYKLNSNPISYDKQLLRDWIKKREINIKQYNEKNDQLPEVPQDIIEKMSKNYWYILKKFIA